MIPFLQLFLIVTAFYLFSPSPLNAKNAGPSGPQYIYVSEAYKVGMFAELSFITGLLHEYDTHPEKYVGFEVDFKKTGFYYDPGYGLNWWGYFFEPLTLGSRAGGVVREYKARDYRFDFGHALLTLVSLPKERVFEIIEKYIHVRQEFLDWVDGYIEEHYDAGTVIGVHYRGTDKKKEVPRVPYEEMIAKVRESIAMRGIDDYKIFVASDEARFVEAMLQAFPQRVLSIDVRRSVDGAPLHEKGLLNQYQCGASALIDCLLLSRTDLLIRTDSNLSLWSTFFNPDIEEILVFKDVPKKKVQTSVPVLAKKKSKKGFIHH